MNKPLLSNSALVFADCCINPLDGIGFGFGHRNFSSLLVWIRANLFHTKSICCFPSACTKLLLLLLFYFYFSCTKLL